MPIVHVRLTIRTCLILSLLKQSMSLVTKIELLLKIIAEAHQNFHIYMYIYIYIAFNRFLSHSTLYIQNVIYVYNKSGF